MNKNVTKLITPRVLYTSNTNRAVSRFDRFTTYYNRMSKNVTISYLREFCAQMSQNVLLADLSDLRLITTVRPKMYKNSFVPEICAQMSQMVFLADFTVFGLLQLYKQK